jgi:ATP-dependent Lon protease
LEYRRRVKVQQKQIGSVEFPSTQFSYTPGKDDVEKSIVCSMELRSEEPGRLD